MRIAVDARELCGKPTGVGRYLGELLTEWANLPDAQRHDWTLYAPSPPRVPAPFASRVRVLPGAGGTAWEQWSLARALAAERPDVLFAPGYSAPLTAPCPIVVVIHDVSFAAHPEWFSAREGLRRRLLARWSARRSRLVITVSAFSKAEIVQRLGQSEARVRVIRHGMRVPPASRSAPREPVVLFVGSIFARRHVDALVDAFVEGVAPGLAEARLEIVGENRLGTDAPLSSVLSAAAPETQGRVRFRSYVDEPTLEAVYHSASVFVFLSDYEGFGLTPLEALARGAVPVVLDTPVSREVYGQAARYVAPGPGLPERLAPVLRQLLTDEAARRAVLAQGPAILSRYDWGRAAAETLAALEEAAGAR